MIRGSLGTQRQLLPVVLVLGKRSHWLGHCSGSRLGQSATAGERRLLAQRGTALQLGLCSQNDRTSLGFLCADVNSHACDCYRPCALKPPKGMVNRNLHFRKQCRSCRRDATIPATLLVRRYLEWATVFLEKEVQIEPVRRGA
ncbi:unnamed protein product [Ixodes pacificus]